MTGIGRRHFASSAPGSAAVSATGVDLTVRKVFFKIEGQPSFTKLETRVVDVADLAEAIIKKLPSLTTVDPSATALHLAQVDDNDNVKSVSETALPPRKNLAAAGVGNEAFIIVKVAGAAPSAAANGASAV